MAGKLKITQKRSTIGRTVDQKKTIHALGLRKMNHVVVHSNTPSIRGMVAKVRHLIDVEELEHE